jgi:RNA polymerase sigma-70 factor (ECF subfamily)
VRDDHELVARLRAGEEGAFIDVVDRYHQPMIRLATAYVPSPSVAEEVVQDTWLGMLRGLDGFQERSSLKTWLFTILVNRARSTGQRERRTTPLGDYESSVDPHRFAKDGQWHQPPVPWTDEIDDQLAAAATTKFVRAAIDELPEGQREVVLLRDVEGLSSAEVCQVLGLADGNQRVLLHRGRARIRRALETMVGIG